MNRGLCCEVVGVGAEPVSSVPLLLSSTLLPGTSGSSEKSYTVWAPPPWWTKPHLGEQNLRVFPGPWSQGGRQWWQLECHKTAGPLIWGSMTLWVVQEKDLQSMLINKIGIRGGFHLVARCPCSIFSFSSFRGTSDHSVSCPFILL